jgi:hypothetical protein
MDLDSPTLAIWKEKEKDERKKEKNQLVISFVLLFVCLSFSFGNFVYWSQSITRQWI